MIITVDNYHNDITYKGIRTYLSYGRIGLFHLENGKKTLPSFHCVIFSDKCVFVEVDGRMGILDLDLSLIAPPAYKEILSVNKIDRDRFISLCQSNQSAVSLTLSSNNSTPTHIAVQTRDVEPHDGYNPVLDDEYKEEEKAFIYEVTNSLEKAKTGQFVAITDEEFKLIDIDDIEIKHNSIGIWNYEFFPLWHYKDNMFIIRNNNGTYVTSTFKNGRFTKKSLWGEYNDSFEEHGSPKVVVHRGEFISVCYPEKYRFVGSPFANKEKEKAFAEKRGKWGLFKYLHIETINEADEWLNKLFEVEKFEQLTSFVFEEPMTQLQDDNEFICHGDGIDFLMRFEQKDGEKCKTLKIDKRYDTIPCSQGQLNIIACYDSIELREDGLLDVTTQEGCGLCDQKMNVIVPAKYDNPQKDHGTVH
ncbi:MAG: hypothetical protein J5797_08905 [Prevotella sp.]|nr:hypothetical protein [Prevotella sp.]